MHTLKRIFFTGLACLSLTGCEKFLDVIAEDKVYEEDLFTARSGFESALAQVYTELGAKALYGTEMSFGFMETLVGTYMPLSPSQTYYRGANYQYSFAQPRAAINGIWGGLYTIINQLNIILKNIEALQDDSYYNLVKGEALGLRAFCHFELYKLFGPVLLQDGLESQAIPYRNSVTALVTKPESSAIFFQLLAQDLQEARQALESDPVRSASRLANLNETQGVGRYNSLIDARGLRMNYYGVVALQALAAEWRGDMPAALAYAEEVINEVNSGQGFSLGTNRTDDRRFSTENIFGLQVRDLRALFQALRQISPTVPVPNAVSPNYTWLSGTLFLTGNDGSSSDFRLINWFVQDVPYRFAKYEVPPDLDPFSLDQVKEFEIKLISLHRLYILAAAARAVTDPQKALDYLNTVRRARNILSDIPYSAELDAAGLQELIFRELRKESIGDGTLFAEYKRLFRAIDRPTPVPASKAIFQLPIPDDERLYNPF